MNYYNKKTHKNLLNVAGTSLCPPLILSDLKEKQITLIKKQKDIKN